MTDRKPEYEGKAKQMFATDVPSEMVQRFKDSATAFNGAKRAEFEGKGVLNNAISCHLLGYLENHGIATHFIRRTSDRDMRVKRLAMVPLEVVVRNVVAGSLAKRTGLPEGRSIDPIVETYLKNDALGDPLLADCHVRLLDVVSDDELAELKALGRRVNDALRPVFRAAGLNLVDFKLEFGRDAQGRFVLADEISPDTCRIWDAAGRKMDKDIFRQDLGDLLAAYATVASRLGVQVTLGGEP